MNPPPVTFTETSGGKLEAFVGQMLVGIVAPYPYSGSDFGSTQATYQIRLPVKGAIPMQRPAATMEAAKRLLLTCLAKWFEESDPERFKPMIADLWKQVEMELA